MHFNIVLSNHGDISVIQQLSQILNYVQTVLCRCGHEVTLSYDELYPNSVNLFFEFFPDMNTVKNLKALSRDHGLKFGVIATELVLDNTIPYAQFGIKGSSPANLKARIDGFRAVCEEAQFVWSFLERTSQECKSFARVSEYFPVGSLGVVPLEDRRAPKDLDMTFFGKSTPHRVACIQKVKFSGANLLVAGNGWDTGYLPDVILQSLLNRSKIGLNLTLHSRSDNPTGPDPRFASCMRIAEMLERGVLVVSEPLPHDNPYAPFMYQEEPEKLGDLCRSLLADGRWKSEGEKNSLAFAEQMDAVRLCKPVIEKTLASIGLAG